MLQAQPAKPRYLVKGGHMQIEIAREVTARVLDSFIVQFELQELKLPELLFNNRPDGVYAAGWQVSRANRKGFVLTKFFEDVPGLQSAAGRIRFTEHRPTFAERFPATNNGLSFGHNRFRNKHPFATGADSIVRFFLRGQLQAKRVMLAGSFNNWEPGALAMQRTDSGWVAGVKLGPGKYWYKFIVDGNWTIDHDNAGRENDGEGNINSIFFRTNTVFFLPGYEGAKQVSVAGSFNQWRPRELELIRTGGGWALPLYLSEGTHTYKFIVDGQWIADPRNSNTVPDGHGAHNSFIALGKPHLFRLDGFTSARQVRVTGSFNNWRDFEWEMTRTASGWQLPLVLAPGNYEYRFIVDGKRIADPTRPPADGKDRSSMVLQPNYTFRLAGHSGAKTVYLAGDFNGWNASSFPMTREGNDWVLPLRLWAGKHRYKFVVDGKWIRDPANNLWEQNEFGTGNSVTWFGQ